MPRSKHQRRRRKQTPQQIARTRRHHLLALFIITFAVYISALPGDFVWHDYGDILEGQHRLTGLSDVDEALTLPRSRYRARFDGTAPELNSGSWQPGTLISNTLSWSLWGKCTFCWHLENLLWHLLVVFALYALGRHVLSEEHQGNTIAFWAAALFAAHPAGVSTIAWIGGRPELLAAAFGTLGLVAFTRLPATTAVRRNHIVRWIIGLFGLGLAAMLSHESAYLLPLAALLIATLGARQRGRDAFSGVAPSRWQGIGLLFGALFLVLLYRQLLVGGLHFPGSYPADGFFNNFGTALRHLWHFVEQALLPSEPVISDAWPITQGWGAGEVAALLGTLLAIGAVTVGLSLGYAAAFGIAWFLLWITPGVGVFPNDHYHSDHFLYLANWGLMLSVVYGIARIWRPLGRQLVRGSEAIVFAPLLVVLMVISGFSNARWWNHESLFEGEIASDPYYIEGRIQLAHHALRNNQPVDALNHLFEALQSLEDRQFTGYWDAAETYQLLALAQLNMELYPDALLSLEKALEARPSSARSRHMLGLAQIELQQYAEAASSLRLSWELAPDNPEIQADLGTALIGLGKSEKGRELLQHALSTEGAGNHLRHARLGYSLLEAQQFEMAARQLETALAYREKAQARAGLALAQWYLGQREDAYRNLSQAMQANDGDDEYVHWVDQQLHAEGVEDNE